MLDYRKNLDLKIKDVASKIRGGSLGWGRFAYDMGLLHAVWQAGLLKLTNITAVELGVASGDGLLSMCQAAQWYSENFDLEIKITGFDTGQGLPLPMGYRDHPETWNFQQFAGDPEELRTKLPDFAELIVGDVKDTIPSYAKNFDSQSTLAFVSVDLDFYSSTVSSFPLFEMAPEKYLPAMPVHIDDMNIDIIYNPWAGESLAINEFNQTHPLRKFQEKNAIWRIENFHAFHVLDHPYRTGEKTPPFPISCYPI